MKHINMYGGLVVAASLLWATAAHTEVQGLQSEAECITPYIAKIADLNKALNDLSAQTLKTQITSSIYYGDYFDARNNRYVFCMDKTNKEANVVTSASFTNSSTYPVVIFGLNIDSTYANPGTSLLTIQGTGEIVLQNLTTMGKTGPIGLRAPILLQGKTTLLDSTISCDAANTAPGITVSSNYNTFRRVKINECSNGLGVTGNRNSFYEVAIMKTAADETQVGGWGLTSTGSGNSFFALNVNGYLGGAMLTGANPKITAMQVAEGTVGAFKNAEGAWGLPSVIKGFTKEVQGMDGKPVQEPVNNSIGVYFKASGTLDYSTVAGFAFGVAVEANNIKIRNNLALGGSQGAVVIAHDPMTDKAYQPVMVTQNNFTTKETIVYAENSDKLLYRLLGMEWIAYHRSATDPDYADRVFGKMLDQTNLTDYVEMNVREMGESNSKQTYYYQQVCKIYSAPDNITIAFPKQDTPVDTKIIEKGEKYFDCLLAADGKTPLKIRLENIVRFVSNTPTISIMSDDAPLKQAGNDPTVLIAPGQVISGEGGGLMDSGSDSSSSAQNDTGGTLNNFGGQDAKVPDMPLYVDDAQKESSGSGGGGSMIAGGGMDAAPATASGGASAAGGCSLIR